MYTPQYPFMQQQPKQLVFAQGIEAAKAVQMNPGDTVPIFDTEYLFQRQLERTQYAQP